MEKRKAKIKLNKKFYDKNTITEAIKDYSNIANIKMTELKEYYNLDFKFRSNLPFIAEEFGNYVLGLMKNKTLV